ncbi:MAG: Arginine-tRNA ligase [Candidatus Magasanikbacteria bacterium GW2011_GWA2_37_8]|uniref:Arginine--tRNA ligase n=1 Tax=Candidatus Magasanikbacteria bacterium GW2011_GWA2_37_8 TaxID=1619036 RepID=A0A0G0HCD3_9BACT|nr:MAG: Arginine-tRNA ligase [Candidatus Magasanikbacteria bacterium GW2011_GWA2_37_8]
MDILKKQIIELLISVGVSGNIDLTSPPKAEMGDLAFGCFGIAKEWSVSPNEAAEKIVSEFLNLKSEVIKDVKVFGPYVNFYLNTSVVAKIVLTEVAKKNFGANNLGHEKKVLIEYPSQNTHKEFHIGHLRIVAIGNTLVNLYNKSGFKMIPINYVNDFGSHVVKCLWGVLKRNKEQGIMSKLPENKQRWLGEVYAEASNYIKEYELEVRSELDDLQKKLEAKDKSIIKLFKQTRGWSIDGFARLSQELGIKHDKIFYESDVKEKGQKIVDQLLQAGIAEVGERGAIIINLEKFGLDIALLRKSTGAGVYLTSDLALAVEKFKKYKVEESINITGSEQEFYFKQLFKILELNGFKNKMTHIGCGLVNLPSGKMSSRTGSVILYEDLRDEIYAKMYEETKSRHVDWKENKIKKIVGVLTMAVLKFTMQKHEAAKLITFDMKEATSFEGFSAPYILYVVARINSLLRKSKINLQPRFLVSEPKINYSLLTNGAEKKLLMLMGDYNEIVIKALKNYNPSVITKYCFDLAQAFNDYYNKVSILNLDDKEVIKARLVLCRAVKLVLTDALGLLTIATVQEM